MKFTLTTLFSGLIVSLFFMSNETKSHRRIVHYTPPKTLTSIEVIESTDLYKKVVKIEDTLAMIKEIQHEQDIERFTKISNR